MNKNLIIAFLAGVIITLVVANYLPEFDIKIEVTEKTEPVKEDKTEKNELSEQKSIVDRLKSKILPEPIPEITADEFLLQNYSDTRISYDQPIKTNNTNIIKTLRKDIGAEFIRANDYMYKKDFDKALYILDNILKNSDLRVYEIATILRLKGYAFAEKEDYQQSMQFLQQSLSYNALEPQAQLDLQFGIAQLYLALDQWGNGLNELLDWFYNAEVSGNPPGPSAHALLSQIYLYFTSETETGSLAEKQFYEKAKPHAEIAVSKAAEPRENWYQIYLAIILFNDNYEEARTILEKLFQKFPEKSKYQRQLAALYRQLDINNGLIPASNETFDKTPIMPDFLSPQFGKFSSSNDADVLPIFKVSPKYPTNTIKRCVEAWVLVNFSVSSTGEVINPTVIDFEPGKETKWQQSILNLGNPFARNAIRAIKKWRYKPRIEDGKAVLTENVEHLFTWGLDENYKKNKCKEENKRKNQFLNGTDNIFLKDLRKPNY